MGGELLQWIDTRRPAYWQALIKEEPKGSKQLIKSSDYEELSTVRTVGPYIPLRLS